jgi:hypothetical protein
MTLAILKQLLPKKGVITITNRSYEEILFGWEFDSASVVVEISKKKTGEILHWYRMEL